MPRRVAEYPDAYNAWHKSLHSGLLFLLLAYLFLFIILKMLLQTRNLLVLENPNLQVQLAQGKKLWELYYPPSRSSYFFFTSAPRSTDNWREKKRSFHYLFYIFTMTFLIMLAYLPNY